MKKTKVVVFIIIFFIILFNKINLYAYSTDLYSIDIPSTYHKISENTYRKNNGNNIIIMSSTYDTEPPSYNKKTLNSLEKELKKQLSSYININIEKKELVKCSKNKYKAYHFISSYTLQGTTFYIEQYYIVTQNVMYIISMGAYDKTSFSSTETKDMINSFTIANYKEVPSSFLPSSVLEKMFTASVVALIFGIVDLCIKRNKKDLSTTDIENKEKHKKNKDDIKTQKRIKSDDFFNTALKILKSKRCTRKQYWLTILVYIIFLLIILMTIAFIGFYFDTDLITYISSSIQFWICIDLFILFMQIKRFRDANISVGWLILICIIQYFSSEDYSIFSVIAGIILFIILCLPSKNENTN